MTAPPAITPSAPAHPGPTPRQATPAQLHWLEAELRQWQVEGIVSEGLAATIRERYVASRRFTLARIVLTLGALFVGVGLIWLVAANLDQMSPWVRITLMVVIWLAMVVASELVARRREAEGDVTSPVVGAVRLLTGGAYGAVVFQAAQSLQVPAYEPLLVGVWGLGVLLWAYAVRGLAPLVLGVALVAFWFIQQILEADGGAFWVTAAFGAAGLAAVAVGVLHAARQWWSEAAVLWREFGAVFVLIALFQAALPHAKGAVGGSLALWVGLVFTAVLAAVAVVLGAHLDRLEVALAAAAVAVSLMLSLWRYDVEGLDTADVSAGAYLRAVVAVIVYLAVASGYAVLGGWRDSGWLTWLATAALVVFVTVQAFAVFAPILSGAALFLVLGAVLMGTGVLADRGRRRLVAQRKDVLS